MFAKELLAIVGSLWRCRNIARILFGVSCLGRLDWTGLQHCCRTLVMKILCLAEAC